METPRSVSRKGISFAIVTISEKRGSLVEAKGNPTEAPVLWLQSFVHLIRKIYEMWVVCWKATVVSLIPSSKSLVIVLVTAQHP